MNPSGSFFIDFFNSIVYLKRSIIGRGLKRSVCRRSLDTDPIRALQKHKEESFTFICILCGRLICQIALDHSRYVRHTVE
jgi:hypothetical protein